MSELENLRAELARLTAERNETVAAANATIKEANRTFDQEALILHRRIRRLEPREELQSAPPTAPPPRGKRKPFSMEGTEDWSDEDRRHFAELAKR